MARTVWFEDYFDEAYQEVYSRHLIPPSQSRAEALHSISLLGVKRGSVVADIACGFGRHARVLAGKGIRVVAVDLNPRYVQAARAHRPDTIFGASGDMRAMPFGTGACDGAILLFNSFGYFGARELWDSVRADGAPAFQTQVWKLPRIFYERQLVAPDFGRSAEVIPPPSESSTLPLEELIHACDRANQQILDEAARILKPGGRFVLELSNPSEVIAAVRETPRRHMIGQGFEMQEEYDYEPSIRVLAGRTTFVLSEATRTSEYWVKLYQLSALKTMLRRAGLTFVEAQGSLEGEPYDRHNSAGLWIVAEKPAGKPAKNPGRSAIRG